jgi:hypothetical protein
MVSFPRLSFECALRVNAPAFFRHRATIGFSVLLAKAG